MITNNSKYKSLKGLYLTYQTKGILCVIGILWFPMFSLMNFISIIFLSLIFILLLKFKDKVISVEIDEDYNSFQFTFYTKKIKTFHVDQITYKTALGQMVLYEKKKKKIVNIEKYTWSNYELIYNFVVEKCEINNYKNKFKELATEIIKEEALDYDSYT
ncbi:hypothetical protein [Carboxylicivirga linearis]|uniref:YcxB-like protein domain-containing protein n=1 Tax=Carboxylicivirga linearis TaxID=1628157 RepID=A0ABS5K170_9BACT|nr:hypothetical protein [Carboxylicivirga linearis]MBS2100879.1 hypothetical protein [Carboxylicivirga linearis]